MNKKLILAFALCFAHNSFGLKPLSTLTSTANSTAGKIEPADTTNAPQPSSLPIAQVVVTVQNALPVQPDASLVTNAVSNVPQTPAQPNTTQVTSAVNNASQQLPIALSAPDTSSVTDTAQSVDGQIPFAADDVTVGDVDPEQVVEDTGYAVDNNTNNIDDNTSISNDAEDTLGAGDTEVNNATPGSVNLSLSEVINQVKELTNPVDIDDLSHVDKTVARLAIETILQAASETPVTEVIATALTTVMANAENPVQVVGLIVQKFQESVQQNNGDLTSTNQDFSNKLTQIRDTIVAQLGH